MWMGDTLEEESVIKKSDAINALNSSSKRGHSNYRRQCRRFDPCHVREIEKIIIFTAFALAGKSSSVIGRFVIRGYRNQNKRPLQRPFVLVSVPP